MLRDCIIMFFYNTTSIFCAQEIKIFSKTLTPRHNNYFYVRDDSKLPKHDAINTRRFKNRYKRDLNKPHDQNEDVYIELQQKTFFVDARAVEKIFELGPYEYKSVSYASNFHYLMQLVLPGLSNLSLEEIFQPDVLMHAEILRLKEMMILKAKLAQIGFTLKKIKENIEFHENEINTLPIELTESYVRNLPKLKHDYSEMMGAAILLKNKFSELNTIQNTCI
ncbi:hypothetical protein COBT_000215 [Conglomerata obtusa]